MRLVSAISGTALGELAEAVRTAPAGDVVEVGVWRGGSAWVMSEFLRGRRLFLFDTFTGIPCKADVDRHEIGDFGDTSAEAVQQLLPHAILKVGVFPDTLTDDVGPIAVAHIDCDQYESVKACCVHLGPRMVKGGVMIFDDPDVLAGAMQAMNECFPGRAVQAPSGKWRVWF